MTTTAPQFTHTEQRFLAQVAIVSGLLKDHPIGPDCQPLDDEARHELAAELITHIDTHGQCKAILTYREELSLTFVSPTQMVGYENLYHDALSYLRQAPCNSLLEVHWYDRPLSSHQVPLPLATAFAIPTTPED